MTTRMIATVSLSLLAVLASAPVDAAGPPPATRTRTDPQGGANAALQAAYGTPPEGATYSPDTTGAPGWVDTSRSRADDTVHGSTATSFDAEGNPRDTVLGLLDDDGQLWVESGHWFRGWYHRAVANPEVELLRDGEPSPYTAVPLDTDEALETVTRLMGKGDGAGYWIGRTMLLWAPIKPVRLDPRTPRAG